MPPKGLDANDVNDTASGDDDDDDDDDDAVGADGWLPVAEAELRIDDTVPDPLTLTMNKGQVAELLGPVADDIVLLELDSGPMLTSALSQIKNACGTSWQWDNPDPQHDCNLTALGQTFSGPDGTWRSSAEYALIRLLTMTPANSQVSGTSIAGMQEIADFIGLGGGFSQILSDVLMIGRTQEFISTTGVVDALQQDLLATHPEMSGTRIPVTLADALEDLAPLAVRLGPTGNHPGVLDPSVPPSGQVLTDQFEMSMTMQSNLRVLDGLDLSGGKDWITVIEGPSDTPPIEVDFSDPTAFTMTGIANNPTADFRFRIGEAPVWIDACTGPSCQGNSPTNPVGAGSVWNLDPWTLEYIIADAARETYLNLVNSESYYLLFIIWTATVDVGQGGAPGGWTDFSVILDIGNPPDDQYVWELLLEVAQRNLHDNETISFAEGAANPAFTLTDVDVGMTAWQIENATRPFLEDQADAIADYVLGDYHKNSGPVDVYFKRDASGEPVLVYIAAEDLAPGADYDHDRPGFFGDDDLSDRVSSSEDGHEVYDVPDGESEVFVSDDTGQVYRLKIFSEGASAETITVLAEVRP